MIQPGSQVLFHKKAETIPAIVVGLITEQSFLGENDEPAVNLVYFDPAKKQYLGTPDWHLAFTHMSAVKHVSHEHVDAHDPQEVFCYTETDDYAAEVKRLADFIRKEYSGLFLASMGRTPVDIAINLLTFRGQTIQDTQLGSAAPMPSADAHEGFSGFHRPAQPPSPVPTQEAQTSQEDKASKSSATSTNAATGEQTDPTQSTQSNSDAHDEHLQEVASGEGMPVTT